MKKEQRKFYEQFVSIGRRLLSIDDAFFKKETTSGERAKLAAESKLIASKIGKLWMSIRRLEPKDPKDREFFLYKDLQKSIIDLMLKRNWKTGRYAYQKTEQE